MTDTEQKPEFRIPHVPLFQHGEVVATRGVMERITDQEYLRQCLMRHLAGDWGTVCAEDHRSNFNALFQGGRILSAFPIDPAKPCKGFGANTLWIITEGDRSVTTFLLPSEY